MRRFQSCLVVIALGCNQPAPEGVIAPGVYELAGAGRFNCTAKVES